MVSIGGLFHPLRNAMLGYLFKFPKSGLFTMMTSPSILTKCNVPEKASHLLFPKSVRCFSVAGAHRGHGDGTEIDGF